MIVSRSRRGAARSLESRLPVAPETRTGAELARLWADGSILGAHQPGCACVGASFAAIEPAAVAQDVLEYLKARYGEDASSGLAVFLEATTQPTHDFTSWLKSLDDAPLEAADKARLLADLTVTLESMRQPSSGFQCI